MREYSQNLVIDILRKDYPEIDNRIRQRLNESLPARLNDITLIPQIVSSFKTFNRSTVTKKQSTERIKLMLSVILLFYQPDKIILSTTEKTKYGLLISLAAELGCGIDTLKKRLPEIIVAFKAYKEFKEETYRLYELIKIEHKFFEYGKEE